jgi:DNA-binding response OmpR family regulator
MHDCPRCAAYEYLLDELTAIPPDLGLDSLDLTMVQRRILGAMLHNPGKRMTKPQLVAAYRIDWPEADWPAPDTVDAHICNMRRRLKGTRVEIATHWGAGYSATVKEAA